MPTGTDRVIRTARSVGASGLWTGVNVRRTESWVWNTAGQDTPTLASVSETSVDGLRSMQASFGLTNTSQRVCLGEGQCITTNTAPDGTYTVTVQQQGHVTSVTRYSPSAETLSATTYTYDPHGRRSASTLQPLNSSTLYTYDSADRLLSVTTPAPGSAGGPPAPSGGPPGGPQTTTTLYDTLNRPWKTLLPDGTSITNTYSATGERQRTSGSRTYSVEYTYDHAGRMKTMKTWRNFANDTGAALTTWNYSAQRGFLQSKQYADAQGPTYTYTAAGRLATRTWARGITTYYAYNPAGDLASVNYDDTLTPGVTHTYDRRGRRLTAGSAGGPPASTLTYNPAGQITSETFLTGPLAGLSITNTYDELLRRSALTLQPFNSSTLYSYDNASRLESVSDGTNTATYTYLANSPLVSQIAFTQNGQPRMTTTKQYDALNRLTSIVSLPQTPDAIPQTLSSAYDYNSANQRTRTTTADGSYWIYQYDTLGQVISGKRFWADGTPVAGQQFEYGFDDIGNRQTAAHGGNAGGSNLRVETYTANDLNQYTQRTVPGFSEVQGRARSDATVTVNLQSTLRQGPYWRAELNADNSASPVWLGITNVAVLRGAGAGGTDLVASNTGTLFLPQTPETYLHDADGNLTRDGRWTNSWDAENRLIRTESLANTPASSRVRQDWTHLPDGRWSQRVIYSWTDNDWLPQATNRFLWDGQVLLAVLNGSNQPEQTYLRGLDLSGTPQGAGGVGGLLAVSNLKSPISNSPETHFVCFDGNGNVTALVAADGTGLSAVYEYDPFGNTLRATGPAAESNSLRFSTQFTDDVTRRVKYLYRDYDAGTGRWLSRDPISEMAFHSTYVYSPNPVRSENFSDTPDQESTPYTFINNSGINNADLDGCRKIPTPQGPIELTTNNRTNAPYQMRVIEVPRCTIKFLYGHNWPGNFTKPSGFQNIWNIVAKSAPRKWARAMVATCSAHTVPNEISDSAFSIAGIPSAYSIATEGQLERPHLQDLWEAVKKGAHSADEICKTCFCKEVMVMTELVEISSVPAVQFTQPSFKFPFPGK